MAPLSLQERDTISSSPMAGATHPLAMYIGAPKGRDHTWACVGIVLKGGYIEETWVTEEANPIAMKTRIAMKSFNKAMKKPIGMKAMKKPMKKPIGMKTMKKAVKKS